MIIKRTVDIEDEVRLALKDYYTIYCRPLPENFILPSLLVTVSGGVDDDSIDAQDVVLDARAYEDAEAINLLLDAVATLKAVANTQGTHIRYVEVNTIASWGQDPVRQNISLCSARLRIYTHKIEKNI